MSKLLFSKSLTNSKYFDDGLGSHIENGEIDCSTLFVNGVQITGNTPAPAPAPYPSITYNSSNDTTTITGITSIGNLNGISSTDFTNALTQTKTLVSPAQSQINSINTLITDLSGNVTSLQTKTQNISGTSSTTTINNGLLIQDTQVGSLTNFKVLSIYGGVELKANSYIIADSLNISGVEVGYLNNVNRNIQDQINDANTATGNNDTDITNIQNAIGPDLGQTGTINQRIKDTTGVASSALAAAGVANGLAIAAGTVATGAATAAAAAQTSATTANGRCSTLETKTQAQSFIPAGLGEPDRTVFDSDVIADRIRTNEFLSDVGNNVAFNIGGTATFSNGLTCGSAFNQTGLADINNFASDVRFANDVNFNQNSANNALTTFNCPTQFNNINYFNGKSNYFYAEIPAYPTSPKAITYFYQPILLYAAMEITGDIRMYDGYKLTCNKIVPNAIIGTDVLQLCSGLTAGIENLKISSDMSIDPAYTFTNNGITSLYGHTRIGTPALTENLLITCDDIDSYAITAKYDANAMTIGTQGNCGTCEIATNTSITLRTATLNVVANTTNIDSDITVDATKIIYANKIVAGIQAGVDTIQLNSGAVAGTELLKISSNTDIDPIYTFSAKGNVVIGDSTQTGTPESFISYSEFGLKSAITFYENITSAYKDAMIFATKTTGATSNWIGTLNMFARNYIYTNINNIYYRTSTASGYNDSTTTISTINALVQNGGKVLHQAYEYDIESPTTSIKSNTFQVGDSTASASYNSYFNSYLSSNYVFILNETSVNSITNPYANCVLYAKKLAGATTEGIGSLFAVARNFTFSNIQNVNYKSADANTYNDITEVITAGVGGSNSGGLKTQANVIDLEANNVYIGKDLASYTHIRGSCYIENLISNDGNIEITGSMSQF